MSESNRDSEYWLLRAQALLHLGAVADASQALTQSAAAGGESSRLFIAQARLDELEQRGDGAAQLLDRAVAVGVSWQERAEALIARASFNVRAQRLREAGDDLRQAADIYAEVGAAGGPACARHAGY